MSERLAIRRVVSYLNWSAFDQAASSGTNFAIAILVVRSVSPAEFGAFSIVVVLYTLSLGTLRAVNSEPLTIRFGGDPAAVRRSTADCLGLALVVGTVFGVACLPLGLALGGDLGPILLVLGVCFPLLLLQDCTRMIAFARTDPRLAAMNDICWLLLLAIGVTLLLLLRQPTMFDYTAVWLGTGSAAGAIAAWRLGVRPGFSGVRRWLLESWRLSYPLLVAYALTTAPPYLLFAFAPVVASLDELGHARAGLVPFSVFGVLLQAAVLMLLPMMARRTAPRTWRMAVVASATLSALALVWVLLVVVLTPDPLGVLIMGEEWRVTQDVQLLFGAAVVAQAAAVGPLIALRALEIPGRLIRVRLITAPLILVGGMLFAAQAGAIGIASVLLVGDVLAPVITWIQLYRYKREIAASPAPDDPTHNARKHPW